MLGSPRGIRLESPIFLGRLVGAALGHMLTRIEIDGFKSFEGLSLDLSPFVVVLGSNASGKSNLFDAVQLLSRLATQDLRSAMKGLRGDPEHLFRETLPNKPTTRIRFGVEVLLEPTVKDPWGQEVQLAHTRVRYELVIERIAGDNGLPRLVVTEERATPILAKEDAWRPYDREATGEFRKGHLKYARRTPWLETEIDPQARRSFNIHQDAKAGRTRPGHAAEATVLSSITTAEFPHLYALREEMRNWRLLQLDPMGLRRPSPLTSEETLLPDGFQFPAAVISDGTLRVLALLTLLHDTRHRGLVCFEEPENGVHPARLRTLIRRLQALVTDPLSNDEQEAAPLSQLLMNSHSPVVLSAVRDSTHPAQILFADVVAVAEPGAATVTRKTRIRPVRPEDQGRFTYEDETTMPGEKEPVVSRFEVQRILDTVNRET